MEENMMVEVNRSLKQEIMTGNDCYCSLNPTDDQSRKMVVNAMLNPDKSLAEMINLEITIKDVYVETVVVTDDKGNNQLMPRIVLIDENGVSYQCVSKGIYGTLKKLVQMYGEPTWKNPIHARVLQKQTRNGYSVLSLMIL